jgi:hypothetical protein
MNRTFLPSMADLFDIGEGRMPYLSCLGTGSPTILLEAGDECELFQWSRVVGDLIG